MRPDPSPPPPALGALVLAGVAGAILSPGIALGVAAAEALRRARLRWTWTLLGSPLVLPVILLHHAVANGLGRAAQRVVTGQPSVALILGALGPLWLAAVPLAALFWKLRRDRRDRLHGGRVEQNVRAAVGPLQLARRRRARERELDAGALTEGGMLLGVDEHAAAVRVAPLVAHAVVLGGSNTGKTNTCSVILDAMVAGGHGFVIADGKGGHALPHLALELGARHQRPVALWSLQPYGDAELDALRLPWNPVGDGNPTEIKDRIASAEQQNEPYYKAIASNGVLTAAQALAGAGELLSLQELARLLEQPAQLRAALVALGDQPHARPAADWIAGLTATELSGLRGMGLRLRTMIASDGGDTLLPAVDGREISLYRAIRDGWLVVFSLPQGDYPDLIPHVTRYIISTVNAVASRLERAGRPAASVFFVDELSAFDGEQLASTLERTRSAGIRVVLATQSLSNFESAGGPKLLHGAIDNAELLIVHRQLVPDAAEFLASVAGTEEAWEHTHKVADGAGYAIGWDEAGERARRLTDRFRIHPNEIKAFRTGEAAVISLRPHPTVRRTAIRRYTTK